ncbi:hypothetical protein AB0H29_13460 [Streptomyces thermolilacinus]
MYERGGRLRRLSRGLFCACVCLALGAAGHVAAGGSLPGTWALGLLLAALTVPGTVLFGGRRRRFDVTALALGATQLVLHLAFHLLSAPPSRGGGHHAVTGHHPGAHAGMQVTEAVHSGPGHAMTASMASAHVAATLGTALCVVHGERVLRRLAGLVLPRIDFTALTRRLLPPEGRSPAPYETGHVRFGVLLARSLRRRGPPPVMPV